MSGLEAGGASRSESKTPLMPGGNGAEDGEALIYELLEHADLLPEGIGSAHYRQFVVSRLND